MNSEHHNPCKPRLSVWDSATQRDLLHDAAPIQVTVDAKPIEIELSVRNESSAAQQITIAVDQDWLKPDRRDLELPASDTVGVKVAVLNSAGGEYGLVQFRWQEFGATFVEPILIVRNVVQEDSAQRGLARPEDPPTTPSAPAQVPAWINDWR